MFYAGTTADIAIWEIALRDKIGRDGRISLDVDELTPWNLAEVELVRDVAVVSLHHTNLRSVASDTESVIALRNLCQCHPDQYSDTHHAANQIIAAMPLAEALAWPSAQCGHLFCLLFYGADLVTPCLRDDLFKVIGAPCNLGDSDGQAKVNAAIHRADLAWARPPSATP